MLDRGQVDSGRWTGLRKGVQTSDWNPISIKRFWWSAAHNINSDRCEMKPTPYLGVSIRWMGDRLFRNGEVSQGAEMAISLVAASTASPIASLSLLTGRGGIGRSSLSLSQPPAARYSPLLRTSFLSPPLASLSFPSSFSGKPNPPVIWLFYLYIFDAIVFPVLFDEWWYFVVSLL